MILKFYTNPSLNSFYILSTYLHDSEIFREFDIACIQIRIVYNTFISEP